MGMGNAFEGLVSGLILLGAMIGGVIVLVAVFVIPWLWALIKPWLHQITG